MRRSPYNGSAQEPFLPRETNRNDRQNRNIFEWNQVGVAPAEAFLMSLLLSLSNLCFVLFGGGLFFLDNCRALWRVR